MHIGIATCSWNDPEVGRLKKVKREEKRERKERIEERRGEERRGKERKQGMKQ